MKTKSEIIAELKNTYPTLKSGSDTVGYTELTADEYEATILQWAENLLAQQSAEQDKADKKTIAEAKLAALGLTSDDLKALGLGGNYANN